MIVWFYQSILGLNLWRKGILRITTRFNKGTTRDLTVCTVLLANVSGICTVKWEVTKEFSAKRTSIGSKGHNSNFCMLLLNVIA